MGSGVLCCEETGVPRAKECDIGTQGRIPGVAGTDGGT